MTLDPSPRRSEAKAEARKRILTAAGSQFAQRGYFASRVADVAREAGMSPGNVYWHFPSKEAILRAILAEGFASFETMTADAAAAEGPARERLGLLVDRTVALYDVQSEFATILATLMGHGGQELIAALGFDMPQIGARYHANLGLLMRQARDEGAVAPVDPDLLSALYFGLFNGLVVTYPDLWPRLERDVVRAAALRLLGADPSRAANPGGGERER